METKNEFVWWGGLLLCGLLVALGFLLDERIFFVSACLVVSISAVLYAVFIFRSEENWINLVKCLMLAVPPLIAAYLL